MSFFLLVSWVESNPWSLFWVVIWIESVFSKSLVMRWMDSKFRSDWVIWFTNETKSYTVPAGKVQGASPLSHQLGPAMSDVSVCFPSGLAGLFTVISTAVFTSSIVNFMHSDLSDLKWVTNVASVAPKNVGAREITWELAQAGSRISRIQQILFYLRSKIHRIPRQYCRDMIQDL